MARPAQARRQQARRRRGQLLESALEVFAEKGVDRATVKDLSKAAGVAEGLLYHYFKSKEDLLRAILEEQRFIPDLRRIVSDAGGRPVADVLLEIVQGFAAVLSRHESLVRLMIREASTNDQVADRLARAQREGVRILSEYLNARVHAGELRPHDSKTVARMLFFAALSTHLTFGEDISNQRFLPTAVAIVLEGIAAR